MRASKPKTNRKSSSKRPAPQSPGLRTPGRHDADRGPAEQPTSALPGPALNLLPYQRRWVEDDTPLKIAVKARQIGYSFAATLRAVLACLRRKTTWIFLSKGERQSRLLMEKVQEHIQSCGVVAQAFESTFFEGALIKQLETRFPNGSVIYGLPANSDTARGYSGNVTLDEFAFHADAEKIYTALFPTITRGYGLEVISTPNGQQGKFYELAKAAGLTEAGSRNRESGIGRSSPAPDSLLPTPACRWSAHSCDIYQAVEQGLKIDLVLLRSGCDDESTWQQEYCCQFVSTAENFIPPELLAPCISAEASVDLPPAILASASRPASEFGIRDSGFGNTDVAPGLGPADAALKGGATKPETRTPNPEFYLGIDIGRHHDRTVFWLDEVPDSKFENRNSKLPTDRSIFDFPFSGFESGHVSIARMVRTFSNVPFAEQLEFARELLSLRRTDSEFLVRRAAIDSTGMGAPLAEALAHEFAPRVEPVVFTAAVKEDMAYRTRRRLEARLSLLPDTREIRRAFSAIKRLVTLTGNLRFDAERTDAGHADEFWAKALADYAADSRPVSSCADAFLADGAPLISPSAFLETAPRFSILDL